MLKIGVVIFRFQCAHEKKNNLSSVASWCSNPKITNKIMESTASNSISYMNWIHNNLLIEILALVNDVYSNIYIEKYGSIMYVRLKLST